MYCEKCGAPLPDGAKFCETCGERVMPGPSVVPSVVPPAATQPAAAFPQAPQAAPAAQTCAAPPPVPAQPEAAIDWERFQPRKSPASAGWLILAVSVLALAAVVMVWTLFLP